MFSSYIDHDPIIIHDPNRDTIHVYQHVRCANFLHDHVQWEKADSRVKSASAHACLIMSRLVTGLDQL